MKKNLWKIWIVSIVGAAILFIALILSSSNQKQIYYGKNISFQYPSGLVVEEFGNNTVGGVECWSALLVLGVYWEPLNSTADLLCDLREVVKHLTTLNNSVTKTNSSDYNATILVSLEGGEETCRINEHLGYFQCLKVEALVESANISRSELLINAVWHCKEKQRLYTISVNADTKEETFSQFEALKKSLICHDTSAYVPIVP